MLNTKIYAAKKRGHGGELWRNTVQDLQKKNNVQNIHNSHISELVIYKGKLALHHSGKPRMNQSSLYRII